MTEDPRHFQSLSIAILAIGTAAVGFGLFGADVSPEPALLLATKLVAGLFALGYYLGLIHSIRGILIRPDVSGDDVMQGPLFWMLQFMGCMGMMFLLAVGWTLVSD